MRRGKSLPCGSKVAKYSTQITWDFPTRNNLFTTEVWGFQKAEPNCMFSVVACFITQAELWRDVMGPSHLTYS